MAAGFWYANGVALAPDESYLVLAETCAMTLHRHWLKGPKVGAGDGCAGGGGAGGGGTAAGATLPTAGKRPQSAASAPSSLWRSSYRPSGQRRSPPSNQLPPSLRPPIDRPHTIPQAGLTEVLLAGLPGFPDGVSRAAPRPGEAGDSFWVSLVVPDMPAARAALPYRALRWALAWAPAWALPAPPQWGAVLRVRGALRGEEEEGGNLLPPAAPRPPLLPSSCGLSLGRPASSDAAAACTAVAAGAPLTPHFHSSSSLAARRPARPPARPSRRCLAGARCASSWRTPAAPASPTCRPSPRPAAACSWATWPRTTSACWSCRIWWQIHVAAAVGAAAAADQRAPRIAWGLYRGSQFVLLYF